MNDVEAVVIRWIENGKTYEKDGALWLKTTEYGDDKDRVIRKSEAPPKDFGWKNGKN